ICAHVSYGSTKPQSTGAACPAYGQPISLALLLSQSWKACVRTTCTLSIILAHLPVLSTVRNSGQRYGTAPREIPITTTSKSLPAESVLRPSEGRSVHQDSKSRFAY